MSSLEQQLELYGGELSEAALAASAVVRAFDPVHGALVGVSSHVDLLEISSNLTLSQES